MLDARLAGRIERKKRELDRLRPLPKAALARLREQFAIELAYNSNAIEGNSLTLRETALVILEGLTIRGKPLREHFEALNHQKAFEFLEGLVVGKAKVTVDALRQVQRLVLAGIDEAYAGRYRDVNVRIVGAVKSPPRFKKVPALMEGFERSLGSERLGEVELAALAHYRLVEIHPFVDGNGRCARLLMNLLLMQKGYPVVIVLKADRKKYYDRLRRADLGDSKPFVDFIGQCVERSLDLYLDAFKAGSDFISLAKAAKGSRYSQEYLSLLARKGRIEAVKLGRNWFIKREALARYRKEQGRWGQGRVRQVHS